MNKIAFITQNLYFGGVQRVVSKLANHFAENNYVSIVLFENKPIAFDIDERVKIHILPEKALSALVLSKKDVRLTLKAGENLYNYRISKLKDMIKNVDADVFVSFEDYNNLISIEAAKSVLKEKKLIVSSRVSIENQYKGAFVHLLNNDFYVNHIKKLYKKADRVISVSEGVRLELQQLGIGSVVIQNGIDINEINTLTREDTEFKDYIVNVGRLYNKQKGQEDLIKAFAMIKDSIKENMIIVGDGPDREYLDEMIKGINLENRIEVAGFSRNPYKYMKNSKFFVFPSYYEGFPNTLIEAMACGCACVSYDFASCFSIADNGKYIKLVETGNIEGLANVMKEFCKDGDMLSFYKKAAAERAKDFDMLVMLKKWEEVIYN
jgi:glycosyltransferase involved in cell wall biosynthesis